MFGSECWFLVTWKRMHARIIFETNARKGCFGHRRAQLERPLWRMHATDFWATDARKVWGKSWMHATYIPDTRNPFNPCAHVKVNVPHTTWCPTRDFGHRCWNPYHWTLKAENKFVTIQNFCLILPRISKTRLSHFGKSLSICFWRHSSFVPDSSKLDSAHLCTCRVLLYNSLESPDLWKLSTIWISRGHWNRKFSAPSSPSSRLKLDNCVQGVPSNFPPKTHRGVGWLGVGERYDFSLQEIFDTADPFSGTKFSQLWREFFFAVN